MNFLILLLTVFVTLLTIESKTVTPQHVHSPITKLPLLNIEDVKKYLRLKEPKIAQLRLRRACSRNLRKRHVMRQCPGAAPPGGAGGDAAGGDAGAPGGGDDGLGFGAASTLSFNPLIAISVMVLILFR